ncbi:MAG: hypothetical protein H7329_20880 [Opitutaceae bacterium]|nr:hypothetical protein [Cytophagales bacterium]
MTTLLHEQVPFHLEEIYTSEFSRIYISKEHNSLLCEAINSYIPIKDFKETFLYCSGIVEKQKIEKFIFDKRALTSFHQPSMEWYFLVWKKEMLELGLAFHRKILPKEEWFRQCVHACKTQMLAVKEHQFLEKIDLLYFDSIQECLEN